MKRIRKNRSFLSALLALLFIVFALNQTSLPIGDDPDRNVKSDETIKSAIAIYAPNSYPNAGRLISQQVFVKKNILSKFIAREPGLICKFWNSSYSDIHLLRKLGLHTLLELNCILRI